jgi:hypothetical protein
MKIGINIGKVGLRVWLVTALLLLGFTVAESTFATAPTELAATTANVARNQSVRLVLFGFAIGVSAILIYLLVFKSPAKASIAKWFHKILSGKAPQDSNSPSFLHDETRSINHTGASPASRITPPLTKTDKLTEVDKKTPLDDDKK